VGGAALLVAPALLSGLTSALLATAAGAGARISTRTTLDKQQEEAGSFISATSTTNELC
jgi:hypothetical protein